MKSISALVFNEKNKSDGIVKKVIFCSEEGETLVRIAELLNNWLMYWYKYNDENNVSKSDAVFYYKTHLELMLKEVADNYEEIIKIFFDSCDICTNVYYSNPFYVESYLVLDLPAMKWTTPTYASLRGVGVLASFLDKKHPTHKCWMLGGLNYENHV